MNERLAPQRKPKGLDAQKLRWIALICIVVGIVARTILEQRILGIYDGQFNEMLEVLDSSDANLKIATAAIIMQLIQVCALPLFAFLLVEGVKYTSNFRNYFLRVLAVAVASEIPYDLAYQGKWLDLSVQNPALGLVVAMAMIFLFKSYAGKGVKSVFVNIVAVLFAMLWVLMLAVENGVAMVVIVAALWFTRKKKGIQVFAGAMVTCVVPSVISFMTFCMDTMVGTRLYAEGEFLRYMMAPLVFLLVHYYNEEPGDRKRIINYAAYPVLLLAGWLIATFVF